MDRVEDRCDIEGSHRPQVDDLDGDALVAHPFGGGDRFVDHPGDGDHGHVRSRSHDHGLADRKEMVGRWLRSLHAVQQPVLDEDHRIGVLDRRTEQAVGVGGGRRHDDAESGDVRQQCFQTLRVLAPRGPPRAELRPHGQRHLRGPTGHEGEFRRLVEQLVEAHAEKVEVHHFDNRAHASHRRANTEADDCRLGDRGVAHPVTELVGEPPGEPEDVASGADVDSGDEHPVVLGELHFQGRADGVHGPEHRRMIGRRRRLPPRRSCPHDEVRQGDRLRAGQPPGGHDRVVERIGHRGLQGLELVVADPHASKPDLMGDQRVASLPVAHLVR